MTILLCYRGDFNILRDSEEKNKKRMFALYVDQFYKIINTMNVREINMGGGRYTWTNNHAYTTLEKLDRILMSLD